ncbi:MAG: septum formation initiator family protein, partial [Nocardioidaceae bacterium]|nr:septum formation initiator family protein [Nocardioidaceae bacterium]
SRSALEPRESTASGIAGRPVAGRSGPRYAERLKAERKQAARSRETALAKARAAHEQKSRLTSRAAILVLVLAVLAVSFASSLRAYLEQRSNIASAGQEIAERKADIADLKREKERWEDPAYVAQQARERFGFVARGETPFIVVDRSGNPIDGDTKLDDPTSVAGPEEPTWYESAWDSMKLAGNPPKKAPAPENEIRAPKQDTKKDAE